MFNFLSKSKNLSSKFFRAIVALKSSDFQFLLNLKGRLACAIFAPAFALSPLMILPAAAEVQSLPYGAVYCAQGETGTCALPVGSTGASYTVYYGIGGNYIYKQGVNGSIGCNQYAFGGDPVSGLLKSCYYITVGAVNALPVGATLCAQAEGGTCTLPSGTTATVYYGSTTSFLYKSGLTGSIGCNQAAFGGDPQYGVYKACYYVTQGSTSACSTIQGNYSVLVNGANSNPSALQFAVGNLNFNGACQISGFLTTSVNSIISTQIPTTGTYKQNSDGSFTVSLTPKTGPSETFAVGYSPIAHEMLGVEIDPSAPTVTASVDLQATSTTGAAISYNNSTLQGTWSASCYSFFGSTDLNYVKFDGAGNISATSVDYYNNSGNTGNPIYTGNYAVSSVDGEFSGTVYVGGVTGQNAYNYWGAISNNANEIQFLYYQNGAGVTTCTGKRS